ncbi:hypothetical protein L204_105240 [Cryptococcus depauperatus]|nr:hypothetical protein L204_03889 [Cryptococcus depauperatus CBS 7855]
MPTTYPIPTQAIQSLWHKFTLWLMQSYPIRDSPLNIRPAMVFATAAWIILLGVLGMAPLPDLPINDKALHFFGLGFATFLLYFVIEVPEGPGRRVWYIRRAPLIVTLILSFFVGGIVSEFVQALLPWKTFQVADIFSNLLGSSLFLYFAHLAYQQHLKRQEIHSLYEPLSAQGAGRYRDAQGREHAFDAPTSNTTLSGQQWQQRATVWDEGSDSGRSRDEDEITLGGVNGHSTVASPVFHIGEDEDAQMPNHKSSGIQLA